MYMNQIRTRATRSYGKKNNSCFGLSFPFHLLKKLNIKHSQRNKKKNGFLFGRLFTATFLVISFSHARVHCRILRVDRGLFFMYFIFIHRNVLTFIVFFVRLRLKSIEFLSFHVDCFCVSLFGTCSGCRLIFRM